MVEYHLYTFMEHSTRCLLRDVLRGTCLCVLFTLNRSFYSSTSSTPSVHADSSS